MARVFKIVGRDAKKSARWYGKVKEGGKWLRVKLFTDKTASERGLNDRQRAADQRESGVRTPAMEFASLPLSKHVADYLASMRLQKPSDDSMRIAEWMLNNVVKRGKWAKLRDITTDSMRLILTALETEAKTPAYQNCYIKRAKAFVNWLGREGRLTGNPLSNLKRVDERNGKRNRARRALTDAEARALLSVAPVDRREKYAWALYAGLRRSELADLRYGDLRLDGPTPFIQLRAEQTKNGKDDVLPLHPYLVSLIAGRTGEATGHVVLSVPDMKTVLKDLTKAKIDLADKNGRRADYHALRHTFCTNLDRTGCSFTTKRVLMRHADSGVTEGYSHSRLAELQSAIERLPELGICGPQVGPNSGHSPATVGSQNGGCGEAQLRYDTGVGIDMQSLAYLGSQNEHNPFISKGLGPSTQVD